MLKVTRAQHMALRDALDARQSIPELCQDLRQRHPAWFGRISENELFARAREAVSVARSRGLFSKGDIYSFVELELTTHPGFHTDPVISNWLDHPDAPLEMRMLYLCLKLPLNAWRRSYCPLPDIEVSHG